MQPNLHIRNMESFDIPSIIELGAEFYADSNFSEHADGYDPQQFAETLLNSIYDDASHVHVLLIDGLLSGFIMFDVGRVYTSFPIACMFMLYVAKDKRQYSSGTALMRSALSTAAQAGARYFYASSTAGLADGGRMDRGLTALYKRLGFVDNGIFMRKEINSV